MRPYLGPPWTDSCQIWCVEVFHHALPKYGKNHENAEKNIVYDVITLVLYRPYTYDVTEGRPGVKRGTATCAIAKHAASGPNIPPGWPGPAHWLRGWAPMRSASTTRARSATSLDPQTWRRCYGDVKSMHKVYRGTSILTHRIYRVAPKETEQSILKDFALVNSIFTLLGRASFPHYNNTKIIKFGWELFISWVISYGLSFSGFARLMTIPAVHKLSEYCVQWSVYCQGACVWSSLVLPNKDIQFRHWLALRFICSWLMNAGMCC